MMPITVEFEPDGVALSGEEGDRLLDLAAAAGIPILAQCGGQGTCGGCRVIVRKGKIAGEEGSGAEEVSSPREVLACQTYVAGDLVVEIPAPVRLASVEEEAGGWLAAAARAFLEPPGQGTPLAQQVTVDLPRPSLDDATADWERLTAGLAKVLDAPKPLRAHLGLLRRVPRRLRQRDFAVTAELVDEGSQFRLVGLAGAGQLREALGVAVDIGTTTVRAQLVDLRTGAIRGGASRFNGQRGYGEDVISRIIYSQEHENGLTDLHAAVTGTINGLIEGLLTGAHAEPAQVLALAVSGNATMIALLLQIPPDTIRRAPHLPPVAGPPVLAAGELGLLAHPDAGVYCTPAVNGYVGGDISAGILATGLFAAEELSMLVDAGTNGEIVLGNRDWMICCACSAGPAFEGMGLSCGVSARPGAIESLRYDPQSDATEVQTIGGEAPAGLCGNGLVETLASLLEARVIDRAANLVTDYPSARLREVEGQWEFVLVEGRRAAGGRDLVLRQSDIENLVRAKAAVYGAMSTMLEELGVEVSDIERLYLGGAFGSHLDITAAQAIGLLPALPAERITVAGNTALMGAHVALLSSAAREQLAELAPAVTYFDLSSSRRFMEEYVAAQMLPHTDLGRFPTVTQ